MNLKFVYVIFLVLRNIIINQTLKNKKHFLRFAQTLKHINLFKLKMIYLQVKKICTSYHFPIFDYYRSIKNGN